jgi:hypothetical protein
MNKNILRELKASSVWGHLAGLLTLAKDNFAGPEDAGAVAILENQVQNGELGNRTGTSIGFVSAAQV